MNTEKIKPLVYNNWDPLEEIWLGDVWPEHFYDDLEPTIRDCFKILTKWTKEDLNTIQQKLESFNVKVFRPDVNKDRSNYIVGKNEHMLRKPPICPRDTHGVIGDRLFVHNIRDCTFKDLHNRYENVYDKRKAGIPRVTGSSIVKLGRDIICDNPIIGSKHTLFYSYKTFTETFGKMFTDYRLHFTNNGGHLDGCFMPVKPGLLLTTTYYDELRKRTVGASSVMDDYDHTLPGWKKINIAEPSYTTKGRELSNNGKNGEWFQIVNGLPSHFNEYVYKNCLDWIGNYKETYFEVNVIMIDEKNMLVIDDTAKVNEPIYEELDKNGVKCHTVPWRTRGFWDGGIHCITLDIKRKGTLIDYWPERGEPRVIPFISGKFQSLQDTFLEEYDQWLESNTANK